MTVSNWARRLNFRARRRHPRAANLPPLILVTDRNRLPNPLAAIERLPRGAAVLLRDYELPDRSLFANKLTKLCRRRGLRLMIAGDVRLAAAVHADGIHFSESAARRSAHPRIRPTSFTTFACHDAASLHRAEARGATACLLSPVFKTASHPTARPLGPWRFAKLARGANLPVYALGGVNEHTARRLLGSGACGVAAIGALAAPGS